MQAFPDGIARSWSVPVVPTAAILITTAIYLRGWRQARKTRPRELPDWRAISFVSGMLSLFLAIASPLDALDDYLLTAHMLQHFILMSITPPLLVLGAPTVPLLRGLPRPIIRKAVRPLFQSALFQQLTSIVSHPMFAWISMNVAFLAWHLPAAYELTLRSEPWHNIEHLCFLFTSILFWNNVLAPWPTHRRWPGWTIIPYLFSADLINTILSAFLAFSGRVLYPTYATAERVCRLTPLQDQVAAGSEMWVLNSCVFIVPAIMLTISSLSPRARHYGRSMAASDDVSEV